MPKRLNPLPGGLVRDVRGVVGLTQAAMADALGRSERWVQDREAGAVIGHYDALALFGLLCIVGKEPAARVMLADVTQKAEGGVPSWLRRKSLG